MTYTVTSRLQPIFKARDHILNMRKQRLLLYYLLWEYLYFPQNELYSEQIRIDMNTKRTILPTEFWKGDRLPLARPGLAQFSISTGTTTAHSAGLEFFSTHLPLSLSTTLQTGQPPNPTSADFTTRPGFDPFKLCTSYLNLTPDLTLLSNCISILNN